MHQFLEVNGMLDIKEKLMNEGFDDMETLLAIERRDFEAMGIRGDEANLLEDALIRYRKEHKLVASTFDLDKFLGSVEEKTREMEDIAKSDALVSSANDYENDISERGDGDSESGSNGSDVGYDSDEEPFDRRKRRDTFPRRR